MADFKEYLCVSRGKDQFGELSNWYDYTRTQEDLADGTFKVIDWGSQVTLGEACKVIDDFCEGVMQAKRALKNFLKNDAITLTDEF